MEGGIGRVSKEPGRVSARSRRRPSPLTPLPNTGEGRIPLTPGPSPQRGEGRQRTMAGAIEASRPSGKKLTSPLRRYRVLAVGRLTHAQGIPRTRQKALRYFANGVTALHYHCWLINAPAALLLPQIRAGSVSDGALIYMQGHPSLTLPALIIPRSFCAARRGRRSFVGSSFWRSRVRRWGGWESISWSNSRRHTCNPSSSPSSG